MRIYQQLIDTLDTMSDRKYPGTKTGFRVDFQLAAPDMSALIAELETPLPPMDGKTVWEYMDVLKGLVGVPGGITQGEYAGIWTIIYARTGGLEALGMILLVISILSTLKHYRQEGNALGTKVEAVEEIYTTLVDAVHATFSGENWKVILPRGLTYEQAELRTRKLLIAKIPELEEYRPLVTGKGDPKRGMKQTARRF